MSRQLLYERRRLGVKILLRHRSFSDQNKREFCIAVALLPDNGLRLKPHHAKLPYRRREMHVPVLIAIILLLPLLAPMPTPMPVSALLASPVPVSSVAIINHR